MDNIDDFIRISLYGLGKRGTESPILELRSGTPYFDYFRTQLEWLKLMAVDPPVQWTKKGIRVAPLTEDDFHE
ncbi:MAG: hypothetical protein J2P57_13240 [Acidimicrobiaceae bacterium]|nr:hypothetical protein [Acidimicrobiaceae bacterium]